VPPYSTCVGYPAKVFSLNREGLKRAGLPSETATRLHRAFRVLFHSKLSIPHAIEQVARELNHGPEVSHLLAFIQQSKRGICRA